MAKREVSKKVIHDKPKENVDFISLANKGVDRVNQAIETGHRMLETAARVKDTGKKVHDLYSKASSAGISLNSLGTLGSRTIGFVSKIF